MAGQKARGRPCPIAVRWAVPLGVLFVFWLAPLLLGGPSSAFDRSVLAALYIGKHSTFVWVFLVITHLGGGIVLTVLSTSAAAWLAIRRRTLDALILLVTVWGVRFAVELEKAWIDRARPSGQHLADVHSASFPSGHAANSLVTYLMIAVILFGTRTSIAIALLLSLVIGLSRLILGVHWPSDVIGGWAFGLCGAMIALSLRRRSDDGMLGNQPRTENHPPEVL